MAKSETLQNSQEEKAKFWKPTSWGKKWTIGEVVKGLAAGVGLSLLMAAA